MAIPHVFMVAVVLVTLLCLPCAVSWLADAEQRVARHRGWARRDPAELAALRQVERRLPHAEPRDGRTGRHGPPPCVEQFAAELRRLDRQRRRGPTTESTAWLAAVLLA